MAERAVCCVAAAKENGRRAARRALVPALGLICLPACPPSIPSPDIVDVVDGGLLAEAGSAERGATGQLVGAFQVDLVAPAFGGTGFTSIVGRVDDGPMPQSVLWEVQAQQGLCRLLTPRIPFCDESCGGSAVCTEYGECQPYPNPVDVGAVRVEGLQTTTGASSIEMQAIAGNYQPPADTLLVFPAFAEGAPVILAAAGTESVPAFSMRARGIAPLELLNASIELVDGQSVTLTWRAAAQPTRSAIQVSLDISHHGGTSGKIECASEDSGALELPALLLDGLKALGVSGFPTIVVTRSARAVAGADVGWIELVLRSRVEREVSIPGLISCEDDLDCPDGETCQPDLRCG